MDANVLGPLDEPGEVALRLDVASNTEVANILLEERSRAARRSAHLGLNDLLSFGSFLHLNGTTKAHVRIPEGRARMSCASEQAGTVFATPAVTSWSNSNQSLPASLTIMIDIFFLINNKQTA